VKVAIPIVSDHPFHLEMARAPLMSDAKPGSGPTMMKRGMRRKEFRQR
jgi:hypothetical protein